MHETSLVSHTMRTSRKTARSLESLGGKKALYLFYYAAFLMGGGGGDLATISTRALKKMSALLITKPREVGM